MLTPAGDRLQTWRRRAAGAGLALILAAAGCAGPPEGLGLEPVYCYRTLADVTCRTVPDAGREGRLVGVYLGDPHDPTRPDYWLGHGAGPSR
jgi:hypothetical protein